MKTVLIIILGCIKFSQGTGTDHKISALCEFHIGHENRPACTLTNAFVTKENQTLIIKECDAYRWTGDNISYISTLDSVLEYIPRRLFEKFPNIEILLLEDAFVKKIAKENFFNCEKLTNLSLARNNLPEIPAEIFNNCPKIHEIILDSNEITSIAIDAFNGLLELKTLSLKNNKLDSNNLQFPIMPSLKFLNLESNNFGNGLRNNSIHNLDLLELHLDNNNISVIPSDFFQNSQNLSKLTLSHNKLLLTFNPFDALQNLKILNLQKNGITSIGDDFFNLPKLEKLYLDSNKIRKLSNALSKLENLKLLNLSNNDFTAIRENPQVNLSKLTSLEVLDFSYNEINQLDSNFKMSAKMKILMLNNNKIDSIYSGMFQEMENLEILTLNENKLAFLSNEIFSQNYNLMELNLAHNLLETIEYELLENLKNLSTLDLSHNRIHFIAPEIFENLNITSFKYSGNNCANSEENNVCDNSEDPSTNDPTSTDSTSTDSIINTTDDDSGCQKAFDVISIRLIGLIKVLLILFN